MAASNAQNYVHKVTITFQDRSKVEFYGVITELKFEGGRVVRFAWKNAAYRDTGSTTAMRLRFVDISKIRTVIERCIGTKSDFDDELFSVTDEKSI